MPYKPGQNTAAGAPKGNKNAATGREARHALMLALEEHALGEEMKVVGKMRTLMKICKAQIEKAIEGDNDSAKIIFDRVDGKPAQAVEIGGQDDNPVRVKMEWTVLPVRASDSDS